jgi:hypothetical protein
MRISSSTIKATVEQLYSNRNERTTYAEFQSAADAALLNLLRGAGDCAVFLGMFTETPLWLAAHRLKARGQVVEIISNCFRLTEACLAA